MELVMIMFILTMGMAGFSILFLRGFRANSFILETGVASSTASRAVDRTVAELRKIRLGDDGSYPIVSGDSFGFTVFVDIDGDGRTERVHYFLDGGAFRRGITDPSDTQPVTYPSGDQVVETVAASVANEPDEPVFFYYNDDYPGDTVNKKVRLFSIPVFASLRIILIITPIRCTVMVCVNCVIKSRALVKIIGNAVTV